MNITLREEELARTANDSPIYVKRDDTGKPVLVACERLMFVWNDSLKMLIESRFNICIYEGLAGRWHCDTIDVDLKLPTYFSVEQTIRHLVTTYCPISESHFRRVNGVRTIPMLSGEN